MPTVWLTLFSLVLSAPGAPVALTFNGAGIVINAGSATITNQSSVKNSVSGQFELGG